MASRNPWDDGDDDVPETEAVTMEGSASALATSAIGFGGVERTSDLDEEDGDGSDAVDEEGDDIESADSANGSDAQSQSQCEEENAECVTTDEEAEQSDEASGDEELREAGSNSVDEGEEEVERYDNDADDVDDGAASEEAIQDASSGALAVDVVSSTAGGTSHVGDDGRDPVLSSPSTAPARNPGSSFSNTPLPTIADSRSSDATEAAAAALAGSSATLWETSFGDGVVPQGPLRAIHFCDLATFRALSAKRPRTSEAEVLDAANKLMSRFVRVLPRPL